jgi:hypothetical protein
MYFSFDTPVNATGNYCGRAVFSDLHVSGDPNAASAMDLPNALNGAQTMPSSTAMPPPGGCAAGALSPQEMVLEFMLFDLSSCVIADSMPPPTKLVY